MAEQINIKLNIDANASNKSVKDLTKEIKELTRQMLQTKTGTQAFTDLSNKIKAARVELNNLNNSLNQGNDVQVDVEVNTEKAVDSINSLQQQIDKLNEQLKDVEIGSEEFNKLGSEVAKANAKMRDTQRTLEGLDFEQTAGELGKLVGGVGAGFAAIQAAVGSGNEEFESFAENIITTIAISNGLKGALESVSAAQKLLNSAMNANPLIKVVAVVGTLIGALTLLWKRTKDNEKATKEAAAKQEEFNNKIRQSNNLVLQLQLSMAEYNKNLDDQIFLQNQIIENEFLTEISEIGKEFGLTADQILLVNNELQSYANYSKIVQDAMLEMNQLKQQENELTTEQSDRLNQLQKDVDDFTKGRINAINSITNRIKLNYGEEVEITNETSTLIANAFLKREQTIKNSNERLRKDSEKTNKDLTENAQNAVKEIIKYRMNYYDSLITREKELVIIQKERELEELKNTNGLLTSISKVRSEITQLVIEQKKIEREQLRRIERQEQQELIKNTKENIKQLQDEMIVSSNKADFQAKIAEQTKILKEEEIRLNKLMTESVRLNADEIRLIEEEEYRQSLKMYKEKRDQRRAVLEQEKADVILNQNERMKFELEILESKLKTDKKVYQDKLKEDNIITLKGSKENSKLTFEERQSLLNKIKELELQYEIDRLTKLESILKNETKLRQDARKRELVDQLKQYEGIIIETLKADESLSQYTNQMTDDFGKFFYDNFADKITDIPNLLQNVFMETDKYINTSMLSIDQMMEKIEENKKLIDDTFISDTKRSRLEKENETLSETIKLQTELNQEIEKLEGLGDKITSEERSRLSFLKQQKNERTQFVEILETESEELKVIRSNWIELWDDITKNEKEIAQIQLLKLENEKQSVEVRLQNLQLIQLQKNALMEISNIEIERFRGNLIKENEALNNQLKLRRDLELISLESLLEQKLISTEEYENAKESIEKVYRRRRTEADIEAYKKVFEFAKIGSDAMFEITSNQQNAIYENRNKQIQETFDKENEALTKSKENGLISEEEYNKQIEKINEEKAKKERKIEYDKAKRDKEMALTKAAIENAINIIEATPNPAAVALASFTGLTQLAVIRSQPLPQYEKGGLLKGKLHKDGGIPLIAEDGEIILNKNVSKNPMFLQMADFMNSSTGGKRLTTTTFNTGMGMTPQSEKIDFKKMVKEVVDGVVSIPVNNVAVDTNRVVRKVQNLENKSKI